MHSPPVVARSSNPTTIGKQPSATAPPVQSAVRFEDPGRTSSAQVSEPRKRYGGVEHEEPLSVQTTRAPSVLTFPQNRSLSSPAADLNAACIARPITLAQPHRRPQRRTRTGPNRRSSSRARPRQRGALHRGKSRYQRRAQRLDDAIVDASTEQRKVAAIQRRDERRDAADVRDDDVEPVGAFLDQAPCRRGRHLAMRMDDRDAQPVRYGQLRRFRTDRSCARARIPP